MTLVPFPTSQVEGVVGKPYKVGGHCSSPACPYEVDHAHHIWGRGVSGKKGGYFWVRLPDGTVVGNVTGLCWRCHDRVTNHEDWIQWRDGKFWWGRNCNTRAAHPDFVHDFDPLAPLHPQPPTPDLLDVSQPTELESDDRCPECGQRKRRGGSPHPPTGARRRRKSWTVKVPDDHEDGADVLDTLVDDLAPLLGIDPSATGRYYVLVPVLVYAQQDTRSFIEAVEGLGGHSHEEA